MLFGGQGGKAEGGAELLEQLGRLGGVLLGDLLIEFPGWVGFIWSFLLFLGCALDVVLEALRDLHASSFVLPLEGQVLVQVRGAPIAGLLACRRCALGEKHGPLQHGFHLGIAQGVDLGLGVAEIHQNVALGVGGIDRGGERLLEAGTDEGMVVAPVPCVGQARQKKEPDDGGDLERR